MSHKPAPRVLAIVINYNDPAQTQECLHCLSQSAYPVSTLIVDNGRRPLNEAARDAVVANLHSRNRGFAAACNLGIRWANERGYDFAWLVNNDLYVEPETLPALLSVMDGHANAAFCGPKIVYAHRPSLIQFAGGVARADAADWLPRGEWQEDCGQFDDLAPVDWISGACLLARMKAIRRIGLLDESYFLYYEDVDWGLRAGGAGWKCLYVGAVSVRHKGSHSAGEALRVYAPRAKLMFLARHRPEQLVPALRRYYHHQLFPHWQQRDWAAVLVDLRVVCGAMARTTAATLGRGLRS